MNYLFNKISFLVLPPAAIVNTATFACNVIDSQGVTDLEILFLLGATDIALTVMKAQEADAKASATTLTGGVDIVGSRFGTDNNDTDAASTLPSATDDNKLFSMKIDMRGRKRYILPVVTIGTGATGGFLSVVALLGRPADAPRTAVEAGFSQRMVM